MKYRHEPFDIVSPISENIIERIISSRFNLPRRIYRKILREYSKKSSLYAVKTSDQNKIFSELGLSRSDGLVKLDDILMECYGVNFDEKNGMFSEHLILLSSISCLNHSIKSILEIGTFDGKTSLILSRLFEDVNILTIDIPVTENDFESTYIQKSLQQEFLENRNKNLSNAKIKFLEANSITLANNKEKFDLIWIDGAHGYPVVSMDIVNSYRLCNKNGYVLLDDVWKQVDYSDKFSKSIASYESLNALKDAKLINNFYLIPKRLGGEYNLPWTKKYVGLFQL